MADTVTLLDSDEDTTTMETASKKRKVVTVWPCVNVECRSGNNKEKMVTADQYSTSFYGVEVKENKKRKVCIQCKDVAMTKQNELVQKLIKGESLFEEKLPIAQDILMLEDSDEEYHTDSSEDEEVVIELTDSEDEGLSVEERLERIVASALGKFNLDFQLDSATEDLAKKIDSMAEDFAATEQMYCDLEENVDNLRRELYKDHEPVLRELPPLYIKEDDDDVDETNTK